MSASTGVVITSSDRAADDRFRPRSYNLGDLFDIVARAVPDRLAVVYRQERLDFEALRVSSDRLAASLARAGVRRGDRVGMLMVNSAAHVIALLAAFKLGAVAFNINYRYVSDELRYIIDDAGGAVVIHDADLGAALDDIAETTKTPVRLRVVVGPGAASTAAERTLSFEDAVTAPVGDTDIWSGRTGEDILLLYTGGTTGMPKGVEWAHEAMFFGALAGGATYSKTGPVTSPEAISDKALEAARMVWLVVPPLIHGGGLWGSLIALVNGQTVVLTPTKQFDPVAIWDLVDQEGVNAFALAGDAMAVPMMDVWEAEPGRWNGRSLQLVAWGGAAISPHVRDKFSRHFPDVMQQSGMGSSEFGHIGSGDVNTGGDGFLRVAPRADLNIVVDGERFAEPGEMGWLARTGHLPRGYWRDPDKTASAFVVVDGRRWAIPGDLARLNADRSMTIHGRDSSSINTGGEKVFAEEVEAVVRSHPSIQDAVVVGAPDPRWGQVVTALVSLKPAGQVSLEELTAHCNGKLARYKLPRRLIVCDEVKRSPAGKADMAWAKAVAAADAEARA